MKSNRLAATYLLIASMGVVGIALLTQIVGGLQPCELCLYERWPYYAAIPLALLAVLGHRGFRRTMLGLIALIFVASSVLAFYHVGVEQHWFAGPSACTGGPAGAASIEALQQALLSRQPVSCDAPQWSFMGITLASLNFAASVVLAIYAILAWRSKR
jgi:disulfide bond formation protein DsbB